MACRSPHHKHRPGGGQEIADAFAAMLADTRASMTEASGRYTPIGTEMISELLIPEVDFYQARAEASPLSNFEADFWRPWLIEGKVEKIPLFAYVYHEYGPIRMDGWGKLGAEAGEAFYWTAARVVLWGGLFELNYEFSALEALDGQVDDPEEHYYHFAPRADEIDPGKAAFVGEVARARAGWANRYLAYGTMLRPPQLSVPPVTLDYCLYNCGREVPHFGEKGHITVPSVVSAGWRYRDEAAALLFAEPPGRSHRPSRCRSSPPATAWLGSRPASLPYHQRRLRRPRPAGRWPDPVTGACPRAASWDSRCTDGWPVTPAFSELDDAAGGLGDGCLTACLLACLPPGLARRSRRRTPRPHSCRRGDAGGLAARRPKHRRRRPRHRRRRPPPATATAEVPVLAEQDRALRQVSEVKQVARLVGEGAINDTPRRWDLNGADLGSMFDVGGKLYMVFGDSYGCCIPGTGGPGNAARLAQELHGDHQRSRSGRWADLRRHDRGQARPRGRADPPRQVRPDGDPHQRHCGGQANVPPLHGGDGLGRSGPVVPERVRAWPTRTTAATPGRRTRTQSGTARATSAR